MSNVLALSVVVQGKEMMPDETEAAIDMVLTKLMPERLASMTDEEFESYKEATAKAFLKPPLGFSDEINQYWPSVAAMGQCFEKRQEELEYLRTGFKNKQQLIDAYTSIVLPKSHSARSRVVVKYWSQDVDGGVPTRPNFKERKKLMEEAGVPAEGIQQAEREHKETQVLDKADSSTRSQFSRKYGHFSEELKCRKTMPQNENAVVEQAEKDAPEKPTGEQMDQSADQLVEETDAAKVAVGAHEVGEEEVVATEASVGSHGRRKKRSDSAMAIDSAARLSVDEAQPVVRGES